MQQIYEAKVITLTRGGLADGIIFRSNNELQEVSRGHSTEKIFGKESKIKSLNEWLKRRIRQIYWKQWKRIKTKHDNLVRLGINNSKAWEWANSRKGYLRISNSYILHKPLTNEYLASVGYDDILHRYKVLHSNY